MDYYFYFYFVVGETEAQRNLINLLQTQLGRSGIWTGRSGIWTGRVGIWIYGVQVTMSQLINYSTIFFDYVSLSLFGGNVFSQVPWNWESEEVILIVAIPVSLTGISSV